MTPHHTNLELKIPGMDCSGCASFLQSVVTVFLVITILFSGKMAFSAEHAASEVKCTSDAVLTQYSSSGICSSQDSVFPQTAPEELLPLFFSSRSNQEVKNKVQRTVMDKAGRPKLVSQITSQKIIVYFFWGKGCPHCEEERQFFDELKRAQSSLEIRDYEVWYNTKNAGLMAVMLQAHGVPSSGVPVTFVNDQVFSGFTKQTKLSIEKEIKKCSETPCGDPGELVKKIGQPEQKAQVRPFASMTTAKDGEVKKDTPVNIPYFGDLDASKFSLPLLTVIIAGMDSFNPCAFFVLLTLLGLLVHAQSRTKMLLIGGTFVFFSGLIYFLFMAAWLNLFLVIGHVAVITTIAGAVSLVIAALNIKDFFLFKHGISLTIPDSAKPKLFDRMRRLLRSNSLVSIMIGSIVLAVAANFYELLCTAGFPMVFTRVLTLNNLSATTYYLYLILYNIVYVVPMIIIVLGFTYTLGKRQLSEWQGRVLKLVSGTMMLGLGFILLINPALLNSVLVSFIVLGLALTVSLLVAMAMKRMGH
jgi:thiol-disulfide isomerase/thioredoxin